MREQDHEVIAAEVRHQIVLVKRLAQDTRNVAQYGIAVAVTERIVDLSEVAQVHEHQREWMTVGCSGLYRGSEALLERSAIWQSRDRLLVGKLRDLLLRTAAIEMCREHFCNGVDQSALFGQKRAFGGRAPLLQIDDLDRAVAAVLRSESA